MNKRQQKKLLRRIIEERARTTTVTLYEWWARGEDGKSVYRRKIVYPQPLRRLLHKARGFYVSA